MAQTVSQPEVDRPALVDRTGFLLGKLGWTCGKRFAASLEPFGMRPKHVSVLDFLALSGDSSQQALCEGLRIDPSTMVALVDEIERRGLAVRRRNPLDRRAHAVHLTDAGRRVLEQARAAADGVEEGLLAALAPEERATLHALLKRLDAAAAGAPCGRAGEA